MGFSAGKALLLHQLAHDLGNQGGTRGLRGCTAGGSQGGELEMENAAAVPDEGGVGGRDEEGTSVDAAEKVRASAGASKDNPINKGLAVNKIPFTVNGTNKVLPKFTRGEAAAGQKRDILGRDEHEFVGTDFTDQWHWGSLSIIGKWAKGGDVRISTP